MDPAAVGAEPLHTRQERIPETRNADEILEAVRQAERRRPTPRLVAEPAATAPVPKPVPPALEPIPIERARIPLVLPFADRPQHPQPGLRPRDRHRLGPPLEGRGPDRRRTGRRGVAVPQARA